MLARLAAAFVAVAMLVGVLRAGATYVYCPSMDRVMDAPCCAGDRRAHHDDTGPAQLRSRDCCEQHVLAKLPTAGITSPAPHLATPTLVPAVATPGPDPRRPVADVLLRFDHEGRAGPAVAARHRAELMVFQRSGEAADAPSARELS